MQDMIKSAESWFEGQRRANLSVSVSYRPAAGGAASDCAATLVIGRWEAIDKNGQIMRLETRDFLIHVDDYAGTPLRGDKIVLTENDVEDYYEVTIPAGVNQAWRWANRSQTLRRIHTQKITGLVPPPA